MIDPSRALHLEGRVALLTGCAQRVLDPEINAATIRLLNRLGVEVIIPPEAGCCAPVAVTLGGTRTGRDSAARATSRC